MRLTLIAVAVAAASLAAHAAMAATAPAPLSFHFQFNDTLNRAGLVEGIVEGLSDNATGPGVVSLTTQTGGSFTAAGDNIFTVADGEMATYSFYGTGPGTPTPALQLGYFEGSGFSTNYQTLRVTNVQVIFTPVPTPAPIPLPAPLALLGAALALLVVLARRQGPRSVA